MNKRLSFSILVVVTAAASLVGLSSVLSSLSQPVAAQPGVPQAQMPSSVPSTITPNIDGGTVYGIAQTGNWIVAGGSFNSATQHGTSTAVPNQGLVAFDQTSGALDTTFAPTLNGVVNTVIAGPTVNTVYVAGAFNTVNGVADRGIVLLNLSNGSIVSGFASSVTDGQVFSMRLSGGHLYLVGSFTMIGGVAHGGVGTINPTSGALDPFVTTQLTGHHNYGVNGTGAMGPVGGHAIDISPNGTLAVVVGNFKQANGVTHDQIVLLTLTGSSAIIDPNWNTAAFSAACLTSKFDSYVEDVSFSPDGSYFAIADTGSNSGTLNTDGTRSLCDAGSRWSTSDVGSDVAPTWVDYTGNDSFWSVVATGTAIYFGGHPRWINNPAGSNNVGPGAIPRPGLVALDPVNGMPLAWNPGRNPRGVGAFALLATAQGLYVGSDTNYFNSPAVERDEIGFFPLAGGYTPASEATTALPANVYEAGPTNTPNAGANDLAYRSDTGTTIGAQTVVPNTGISWSTTRGAFMVGSNIYYGSTTDGNFYSASFTGSSVSSPVAIDPYDDPLWDGVQTGSGQTYQGQKSGYYSEIPSVTGAFYSDGRLYYSLAGKSTLRWRYFTPDSGAIGGTEFTVPGGSFGSISGMFLSAGKIYYANSADGTLHTVSFSDGGTNGINPTVFGTDTVVSGPGTDGNDWRSQSMFLFQPSTTTQSITFNAATHATVQSGTSVVLTTPATVGMGDAELLYVTTSNAAAGVIATPAGWTPVTAQNSAPLQTAVFIKTATANDAGSAVTATVTAAGPLAAQLVDYSGASTAIPVTTGASDSSKTVHTAPAVQVTSSGSWVVSFWSDKSSTTTNWTLPAVSTLRDQALGTGSTRVTAALGDSNAIVPTGTYPARSASVGTTASGKAAMVSLVLVPQTVVATTTPPTTTPTTAPTTTPTTTAPTTTPPPPPTAAFTAAIHGVVASGTSLGLTTPAAVTPGDAELLYVTTSNTKTGVIATPVGWTQVTTQNSTPLQAAVFTKTATTNDPGSTVTATVTSAGPLAAELVDYTGLTATPPVTAGSADSSTASHVAPAVTVATAGSWVVSFWSDKSSSTTAWTPPSTATLRDQVYGTGGGRVTALIADSNAAMAPGTYPTQTATVVTGASGKAAMVSLVLVPTS